MPRLCLGTCGALLCLDLEAEPPTPCSLPETRNESCHRCGMNIYPGGGYKNPTTKDLKMLCDSLLKGARNAPLLRLPHLSCQPSTIAVAILIRTVLLDSMTPTCQLSTVNCQHQKRPNLTGYSYNN